MTIMFSPSAIADFRACQHLNALNRAARAGEIKKPYFADPGLELLRKLGLAHEQKYLKLLTDEKGLKVVAVPDGLSWSEAARQTLEAMRGGAEVIYQATFFRGEELAPEGARGRRDACGPSMEAPPSAQGSLWYGRADFLMRVETPSELGDWSYEVVETKLARLTKARALIQLCFYSELVGAIQGMVPERMHVVLGRGVEPEEFSVKKYLAYFRKVTRDFEAALAEKGVTYPEPVEHCGVCDWYTVCDERWHRDDHLSLVANITRNQRKALVARDVSTMAQLAALTLPVEPKIERIAPAPLLRIREQARVQVQGRERKEPFHELIQPVEAGRGLAALPTPSRGDVFLDFEGDPFAFEQGLEYLIGTVTSREAENGGEGRSAIQQDFFETERQAKAYRTSEVSYEAIWSFSRTEEKKAFEKFIGSVME